MKSDGSTPKKPTEQTSVEKTPEQATPAVDPADLNAAMQSASETSTSSAAGDKAEPRAKATPEPVRTPMTHTRLEAERAKWIDAFFDPLIAEEDEGSPVREALEAAKNKVDTALARRQDEMVDKLKALHRDDALTRLNNPDVKWVLENGRMRPATSADEPGAKDNQGWLSQFVHEIAAHYQGEDDPESIQSEARQYGGGDDQLGRAMAQLVEAELDKLDTKVRTQDEFSELKEPLLSNLKARIKAHKAQENEMLQYAQLEADSYFRRLAQLHAQELMARDGKPFADGWAHNPDKVSDANETTLSLNEGGMFETDEDKDIQRLQEKDLAEYQYERPPHWVFGLSAMLAQVNITLEKDKEGNPTGKWTYEGSVRASIVNNLLAKAAMKLGLKPPPRSLTFAGLIAHFKSKKLFRKLLLDMQQRGKTPVLTGLSEDTQVRMLYLAAKNGIDPRTVQVSDTVKNNTRLQKQVLRAYHRYLEKTGASRNAVTAPPMMPQTDQSQRLDIVATGEETPGANPHDAQQASGPIARIRTNAARAQQANSVFRVLRGAPVSTAAPKITVNPVPVDMNVSTPVSPVVQQGDIINLDAGGRPKAARTRPIIRISGRNPLSTDALAQASRKASARRNEARDAAAQDAATIQGSGPGASPGNAPG